MKATCPITVRLQPTIHPPQKHLRVKCRNTSYTIGIHTKRMKRGGEKENIAVRLTEKCPKFCANFSLRHSTSVFWDI